MGTHNPLSGIRDYEWYDPRVVTLRRRRDHIFLEMMLAIRALEETRYDPTAPPTTEIHATAGPFDTVLRALIARVFHMDFPASRETAYRWIVGYLRDHVADEAFGLTQQDNSAVLTGIHPGMVFSVARTLDRMSLRFRAHQLSDTAVVLTIHGDVFGDAFGDGFTPVTLRMLSVMLWGRFLGGQLWQP
jgi:hypothetical protein